MTSLHETLPILDGAVPAVAPKLEGVAQDAAAFHKAVRDLMENLAEKESQARELLGRVQAALAAVHDGAERMDAELGRSLEAAEGAVEEALQALAEGRGELRTALQSAGDAMDDLKTHALDAGGRMESAQQDAGQALDRLGQAVETEGGELDGAVASVEAAAEAVDEALSKGRTTLADAAAELGTSLSSLLGEVREGLAGAEGRVAAATELHQPALLEVVAESDRCRDRVLSDLRERVQAEIGNALGETMIDVTAGLSVLGETVARTEEEYRAAHEELQEQLTELLARIPTMQVGVEQVRQAAATAGVAWPG